MRAALTEATRIPAPPAPWVGRGGDHGGVRGSTSWPIRRSADADSTCSRSTRRRFGAGGASAPFAASPARASRGNSRGATERAGHGLASSRDGSLAGVLVLFAIAEVGEWHLPFTRKPGRGRAGGRTASWKRATATSQGMPGDGPRRQSRGTGAEPEKGFSTMDGISGRTSHGSFMETWWTRPRPSTSGSTGVSPKAAGARNATGMSEPSRRKRERRARKGASMARPAQRADNARCGGTTDGEADRVK
jgi:hypothetical protein